MAHLVTMSRGGQTLLTCTAISRTVIKREKGYAMPTTSDQHDERQNKRTRTARLDLRVTPEDKELIERAAEASGRSQTDFVVSSARSEAQRTLREYDVMRLSERDRDAFVDAFLTPPEPNERLREAAERYRERTSR